jgi:hypothetical protein
MNSTLDPQFLVATMHVTSFKRGQMLRAQGALLTLGLRWPTFTAADLPGEITGDNKHLAGCATGALAAQDLIRSVGRVKSPRENAKGRKLDVFAIPNERVSTARAWLRANGMPDGESASKQLELLPSTT